MDNVINNISIPALVVVLVILYFAISGYRRGFLQLAVSLVSMVLGFYLVSLLSPYISTFLMENTSLYGTVKQETVTYIEEKASEELDKKTASQEEIIDSLGFPGAVAAAIINSNTADNYENMMVNTFSEFVGAKVAELSIKLASFLCTYFLVMMGLRLTFLSMKFIRRIPVIGDLDRYAGLLFGAAQGIVVVWLFMLASAIFASDWYAGIVKSSRILTLLHHNNFILNILLRLL